MKLISVNVGLPREVIWKNSIVTTGIFKEPITGRAKVYLHNIEGDGQADLSVHGGAEKAVYVYPAEHYEFWREELPESKLSWGAFGENLTVEGLFEEQVNIGDRLQIGSAQFEITQPRFPCQKLSVKFGREDIVKRFMVSRRTGFYLSVLTEGELGAGDEIELLSRDVGGIAVADIVRLQVDKEKDFDLMRRAINVEALAESWRNHFLDLLEKA